MDYKDQVCHGCFKSTLISTLVECTFYGAFSTLFIISTSLLTLRWRMLNERKLTVEKKQRISLSVYLSLGFMMFLCLTGVWIFSWLRLFTPRSLDADHKSSFFLAFTDGSEPLDPAIFGRGSLFVATSKFSDAILTYRLWIIFRGSLRAMAFPYLIWIGFLGLIIIYITDGSISLSWLLALMILSICLNVYFTASVIYRLRGQGKVPRYGGTDINKAAAIVIESASIYTIWLLLVVITFFAHAENISGILADGVAPVAGIVTMLVNVRVGLGWAWVEPVSASPPASPGIVLGLERWYTDVTLMSEVATSGRA